MNRSFTRSLLIALALYLLQSQGVVADTVGMAETPQRLTFPLGEHYRIGRYLPVRVNVPNAGESSVRIAAPGAVSTELWGGKAIVPLLAVTPLGDVTWSAGTRTGTAEQRLRPLEDHQRLIGFTTHRRDADALAVELFPGKQLVRVPLDLANPLPGPAIAWGALDAVLLDEASAARITEAPLSTLLAAGTTVAIKTDTKPAGSWPWEQRGGWWVVRVELAGPQSAIEPDAYLPIMREGAGWPVSFRQNLFFILLGFAILVVAASLWRSKRASALVVMLSVAAVCVIVVFRFVRFPVRSEAGRVYITSANSEQCDRWTYHAALGSFRSVHGNRDDDPQAVTRPIFASRKQFEAADPVMECVSDGSPYLFYYTLGRGQVIAFLSRTVVNDKDFLYRGRAIGANDTSRSSPLRTLVEQSYLSKGDRIVGTRFVAQTTNIEGPEWWPDIVIERADSPNATTQAPSR